MNRKQRLWIPLLMTLLVSASTACWTIYNATNAQMNLLYRLAGGMLSAYPDQRQTIVEAFSSGDIESGRALFAPYGFQAGLPFWLNDFLSLFVRNNIWIYVAMLMFILIIWLIWYWKDDQRTKLEGLRLMAAVDDILSGGMTELNASSAVEARLHQITTKLRHGSDKLAHDKAQMQSLVTDISHQIKTPLASIQMFNGFLLEGGLTPEEQHEFLHRSQGEIEKLGWLAQSLVIISRMETGMIELKLKPSDLREPLTGALENATLNARARHISIEIDMPDTPLIVMHDMKWTREAIYNLLDNAIKYGREGGHIRAVLIDLTTAVRIDIIDDGPGVTPDEVNHIFRRFFRGSASTDANAEGAGVGLYLTREIISKQHGSVTVEKTPGGGATFRVFLSKM